MDVITQEVAEAYLGGSRDEILLHLREGIFLLRRSVTPLQKVWNRRMQQVLREFLGFARTRLLPRSQSLL